MDYNTGNTGFGAEEPAGEWGSNQSMMPDSVATAKPNSLVHRYNSNWAIVVGATKEIGTTWSDRLAAQGFNLVVIARSLHKLQSLAHRIHQQYNKRVRMIACDLNDVQLAMQAIINETQDLDVGVLVHNASTYTWGRFLEQDCEYHKSVVAVNVQLSTALCHHFGNEFSKRGGGAIFMMSSIVSSVPQPFLASYSASKAYITNLCETLYTELKDAHVDVLSVMPGATSTKQFRQEILTHHRAGQAADVMSLSGADVVDKAIATIGTQPCVVIGITNKLSDTLFNALPRKLAMNLVTMMTRLNFNDWSSGSKPFTAQTGWRTGRRADRTTTTPTGIVG